jgi:hypothetical protein
LGDKVILKLEGWRGGLTTPHHKTSIFSNVIQGLELGCTSEVYMEKIRNAYKILFGKCEG